MLHLRATVTTVTGKAKSYIGTIIDGRPVRVAEIPPPAFVEIVERNGAFFLVHLDAKGQFTDDSWHQSEADAKAQAEFEFGHLEWKEMTN